METQTIINIVFAVAFVGYIVWQRNPTFNKITCKGWKVMDADGKMRINAKTLADGEAGVTWYDKDGKFRIAASTRTNGNAGVQWIDKDGNLRISASTIANGFTGVQWLDKDGKVRIQSATIANGNVSLPTEDLKLFQ